MHIELRFLTLLQRNWGLLELSLYMRKLEIKFPLWAVPLVSSVLEGALLGQHVAALRPRGTSGFVL